MDVIGAAEEDEAFTQQKVKQIQINTQLFFLKKHRKFFQIMV